MYLTKEIPQVGDVVTCDDNAGIEWAFEAGREYTVTQCSAAYVRFDVESHYGGGWEHRRFQLIRRAAVDAA